jgi:subtilisin-like proprotein convertase family protein
MKQLPRTWIGSTSRLARAKLLSASLVASSVALLLSAGSAGATSFPADGASLGAIPDSVGTSCNPGAPRNVTFTVTGVSGAINDVQVSMTFSPAHTWVGDLEVVLIAPDATSQTIFSRTGSTTVTGAGDSSNVAGPYTFADAAPASPTWWGAAAAGDTNATLASGSYRASTPGGAASGGANTLITPTFAGLANPNGTWTLRFRDCASVDTGSVSAATLGITTPPANDNFANAQVLSGSTATASGSNVGATEQPGEDNYSTEDVNSTDASVTRSVWYSWTSPGTGPATADVCTSNYDTMLAVFTGSVLGSLSLVGANNNHVDCPPGSFASKVSFTATQGTTYRILVDGCCGLPSGNFTLNVNGPSAPPPPPPPSSPAGSGAGSGVAPVLAKKCKKKKKKKSAAAAKKGCGKKKR